MKYLSIALMLLVAGQIYAADPAAELTQVSAELSVEIDRVANSPEFDAANRAATEALLAYRAAVGGDAQIQELDMRMQKLTEQLDALNRQRLAREQELAAGTLAQQNHAVAQTRAAVDAMLQTPQIKELEARQNALLIESRTTPAK